MKKQFFTVVAIIATGLAANAQVGIGTTTPNASAALDITSTTSGLLVPRMTTGQRTAIASPATGLQVYDTNTNSVWYYNGTAWTNSVVASDLRLVGTNNHVTSDAGISGNGTSLGSGNANTAINAVLFSSNITGVSNVAIGASALSSNTAGSQNIGLGYQAVYSNSTGNNNVGLGFGSLFSSTGSNNVGVGISACNNVTTGSNNISLGYSTNVPTPTASNQLNIGNVLFGTGLTGSVAAPAGSLGIGTVAPSSTAVLDVTSTTKGFLMPRMTSAQRVAITTPATGLQVYDTNTNTVWFHNGTAWVNNLATDLRFVGTNNHITSDAGAGANGSSAGSGSSNVGIGSNTLSSITSGSSNIAIGASALASATTAGAMIAMGPSALQSNTSGGQNLAVGLAALGSNNTGSNNHAIGWTALGSNTSGGANIAMGYSAVASNTTGSNNVGIGYQGANGAGNINNNVALGNSTLPTIVGDNNTGIGNNALNNATAGNENTVLGASAGTGLTSGSRNIAIGYQTSFASNTGSNQMNIGNAIFGTGLNGTVVSPAGSIGIGTAAPNADAALTVSSPSANKGLLLPVVTLTSTASFAPLSAHVAGMVVYNTATINDVVPGVYVNTGAAWTKL